MVLIKFKITLFKVSLDLHPTDKSLHAASSAVALTLSGEANFHGIKAVSVLHAAVVGAVVVVMDTDDLNDAAALLRHIRYILLPHRVPTQTICT